MKFFLIDCYLILHVFFLNLNPQITCKQKEQFIIVKIKSLEFGLFVNYHVLDKKDW